MANARGGGGSALLALGVICVALGMTSGRTGLISAQGERSGTGRVQTVQGSSHVVVENPGSFAGTFRVRTDSCQDDPGADDVSRVVVAAAKGEVARADAAVTGTRPVQHVSVGQDLSDGRYTISVQCLSDGQPVGDTFATKVVVTREGAVTASYQRPSAPPKSGD